MKVRTNEYTYKNKLQSQVNHFIYVGVLQEIFEK